MTGTNLDVELIEKICEHQPEAIIWLKPVMDHYGSAPDQIKDFTFHYCNKACSAITGKPKELFLGKSVLQHQVPDPSAYQVTFQQCVEVYTTGKPLQFSYFSSSLDKYLTIQRIKLHDGVLTTVRDRTKEYKSDLEKEDQSRLLNSLIENSPYGISVYESIRDKAGNITDFKLKLCNKRSAELTGFTVDELRTHTAKELMVIRGQMGFFEVCSRVVTSGEPYYTEIYSQHRKLWFGLSIVKFEDGYLLNYIDISETKRLSEQARENANELDAIFNHSLSGVYAARVIRNEKGSIYDIQFLRANDTFYKIFGTTPAEIIGSSLRTISNHDDPSLFLRHISEVVETRMPAVHVLYYPNPDRWFEYSIVLLKEDVVAVTVNNITEQKLATLAIEMNRNLLNNIMKQSPNGLSITKAIRDEKGQMVDAIAVMMNDACEKFNGVPNEVLLTNSMGTLDPTIVSSPLFESARALEVGASFRTEYFLPLTGRWLELAVAKLDDDHFINVFTDISGIKKAQQELEQTIEELRRLNDNLKDFAYAASHDLKEPIRKIHFFANQIRTQYVPLLDEKGTRMFERLEFATQRMSILVDDLLEYSYVNQGVDLFEQVDLQRKVALVMEDLELTIKEKNARVIVGDLPSIKGHKRQLQQLFNNLIGNAIKYSKPKESPVVTINAKMISGKDTGKPVAAEQTYWLVTVKDNGIGFPQEDAERIFNVFTRLHGNAEYKGSGVGLAIVRKVVENHHGYIWAESAAGEGSVFNVLLPAG